MRWEIFLCFTIIYALNFGTSSVQQKLLRNSVIRKHRSFWSLIWWLMSAFSTKNIMSVRPGLRDDELHLHLLYVTVNSENIFLKLLEYRNFQNRSFPSLTENTLGWFDLLEYFNTITFLWFLIFYTYCSLYLIIQTYFYAFYSK